MEAVETWHRKGCFCGKQIRPPLHCLMRQFLTAGLAAAAVALAAADQDRRAWRDYAGGPDSSRFVTSKQINASNVRTLDVAWTYPHGDTGFNPIVVDGVVYARGRNSSLIALDAATGREIWIHDGLAGMTIRGIN